MIEYPSILSVDKSPRGKIIAFNKLDGSNIRVLYTRMNGFCRFGSRNEMFDLNHPFLAPAIPYFREHLEAPLLKLIDNEFPKEKEIVVFLEFFGDKSFAGRHVIGDTTQKLVCFDILVGNKNRKFIPPQQFIDLMDKYKIETPIVIYKGELNDEFIKEIREGHYHVDEGVVCKGIEKRGDARGGIWMCKIKTKKYLAKLLELFGQEGVKKYGE